MITNGPQRSDAQFTPSPAQMRIIVFLTEAPAVTSPSARPKQPGPVTGWADSPALPQAPA